MGVTKASDSEIAEALTSLTGWTRQGDQIVAEFSFPDFRQAFGFMAEIALWAEKLNHHPTWSNTYNRVSVALSTHDVGGLSAVDFELAEAMSAAYSQR